TGVDRGLRLRCRRPRRPALRPAGRSASVLRRRRMMPSPALPVPSPAPSAPSASGPPANGGDAAGSVNFDALLTLLAGTGPTTVSAPTPGRPPAPARPAASARSAGSDKDADGPPTGTAPAPGSLEALVAALAQQLCGGSPAVIPPDPPSGGEAAVGQPAGPPPAVAQAVAPAVTPHPVPDAAGVPITAAGSPATEPILSTTGPVPPPTGPVPSPKPSPAADSSAAGRSPVAALADRRATAAPAAHDDAVLPDPAVRAPVEDAGPLGSGPHEPAPEPARRPSGPAGVEPQVSVPASAGPAPAGPAGAAEAPAASSGPAPAAAPVAVADQIVSAVVPLHGRGGGRHEVTLELRPESLGAIRVELSVEHETVHLTLHA